MGEDIFTQNEHYELSWAGKAQARREIQKTTSATLTPDSVILSAAFSHEGVARGGKNPAEQTAQHVFIEGENLEVLRVLQKSYFGRVKMIYIDPPYNTGNDSFVYPDDYTERLSDYKKRTGLADENGFINKQDLWRKNSKESGQYHSVWLSMMYPRLYLARNLLRDDGVIFISIDDNEAANLKLLCDEVFGAENFVAQFVISTGANQSGEGVKIQTNTEYNYVFAKNIIKLEILRIDKVDETLRSLNDAPTSLSTRPDMGYSIYYNPVTKDLIPKFDYDKSKISSNVSNEVYVDDQALIGSGYIPIRPGVRNNLLHRWRWGMDTFQDRKDEIVIEKTNSGFSASFLQSGFNAPKNLINFSGGTVCLRELFDGIKTFDFPKSTKFIKHLLSISTKNNDIILDFFAGSGTTAQAVMELNLEDGGNRQCICVQMPEVLDETSEAHKAGYRTIADITRARIAKVIAKLKAEKPMLTQDLACANFTLTPSHFKVWQPDVAGEAAIMQQLELHQQAEHPASLQQNMLTELLLKMGLGLAGVEAKTSLITVAETEIYAVSLPESGLLWLCFNSYKTALKAEIVKAKPQQIVFLNSCFTGSNADEQLTNLELELQQHDIKLTVI